VGLSLYQGDGGDDQLAYKFPLSESQPVVRITVAGPAPFNTLIVARLFLKSTDPTGAAWISGRVQAQDAVPVVTIIGYDPRVTPEPQHSTAAYLIVNQATNAFTFTIAVDDVGGFVTDDGVWMMTVDSTFAGVPDDWSSGVILDANFGATVWLLCYEPPPPTIPGVQPEAQSERRSRRAPLPGR
jgi:hypothetical protein